MTINHGQDFSGDKSKGMIETTILLVDDEAVIRKVLSRELTEKHFSVTAVSSGNEAIRVLQDSQFDVVISDLMMEGIDGFGVLKAVKKMAPLTRVIILTGNGDLQSAIDALRLGADDFLIKPCVVEELILRIRSCLEKQSLLKLLTKKKIQLEEEIDRRRLFEAGLEQRVEDRTAELHESNVALTVILKKREQDRTVLAEQVLSNVTKLVQPYLDRLEECRLTEQQQVLVDILRANINEVTSPFSNDFSNKLVRLTPAEIQVANLVKLGKRTKEIAEILHLSSGTISIHRKNIRKKLDLTHQKSNLQSILSINY